MTCKLRNSKNHTQQSYYVCISS